MDVREDVLQIIADYKNLDRGDVTPERTFEELGIDSLDAIDIIYEVEDKFSVDVPQEAVDMEQMKSVGDVLALVERITGDQGNLAAGS